jgi:hypothetical protein
MIEQIVAESGRRRGTVGKDVVEDGSKSANASAV